jgi:hypothetical protein
MEDEYIGPGTEAHYKAGSNSQAWTSEAPFLDFSMADQPTTALDREPRGMYIVQANKVQLAAIEQRIRANDGKPVQVIYIAE